MRKPSSDSVRLGQVVVFTAAHGLSATYIGMWQSFTWTWHKCGGVQCLGAQCGKARHKIGMDHVRGAHDVPWDVKSASLDQFLPPWTVRRQVWSDSLKQQHSGISTDIFAVQ